MTNRIYISNSGNDNITVIDRSNNGSITTIPVGSSPRHLAVNSLTNRIYVPNFDSGSVTVLDGTNNSFITNIPVGANPLYVAVYP